MNEYNLSPKQMAEAIYEVIVKSFSDAKLWKEPIISDIESIITNGLKRKVYLPITLDNLKAAMRGEIFAEDTTNEWKNSEQHRVICVDSHLQLTAMEHSYPIVTLNEKGLAAYWQYDGAGTNKNNYNDQLRLYRLE